MLAENMKKYSLDQWCTSHQKRYFRPLLGKEADVDVGMVSLGDFFYFFGIAMAVTTVLVAVFKKERATAGKCNPILPSIHNNHNLHTYNNITTAFTTTTYYTHTQPQPAQLKLFPLVYTNMHIVLNA